MKIEKEWMEQMDLDKGKEFAIDMKDISVKQRKEEWYNAQEHSGVGYNSHLRKIMVALMSKPKKYEVVQLKIWAYHKKYPFMKPRYKVYGIWVKWSGGEVSLIRGYPIKHHSHFNVSINQMKRWCEQIKQCGLVGGNEKPITKYCPPLP